MVGDSVEEPSVTSPAQVVNNIETQNNTTNNTNVNITVNLDELRKLLKDLDNFTIKRLYPLLVQYGLSKHGNKEKKIIKLKDYIKRG